jgi:hypothetical protein
MEAGWIGLPMPGAAEQDVTNRCLELLERLTCTCAMGFIECSMW